MPGAGRQFDPRVVEVFLKVPVEQWIDLRNELGRHSAAGELCCGQVA
jgi:response regulator RpfG family c-di-GMP phosphodiesterase